MKIKIIIILLLCAAVPAMAQSVSVIANVTPPCTAMPLDGSTELGGNADPTNGSWGGCLQTTIVGPFSTGLYVSAEQDAIFVVNSIGYNAFLYAFIEAPTGCNGIDELTARGHWNQQDTDIFGDPTDALIFVDDSCYGTSCDFEDIEKWFGGVAAPQPPVIYGIPYC